MSARSAPSARSTRRLIPQPSSTTPRTTPPAGRTPPTSETKLPPAATTQPRHVHQPSFGTPYQPSAATYPKFLPLVDTAKLQLGFFIRGLWDANRWDRVIKVVIEDAEVRSNVFKSLLLNSLSLASIYTLDLIFVPLLAGKHDRWLHRNFGSLYTVFWLLPVIGVSLYLNSAFSSSIAKKTFRLQHGRSTAPAAGGFSGMLNAIATSAYRVILIFSYMSISLILSYVPILGSTAAFIFVCWIDAFYCFDFMWDARGMRLSERMRHEEERWAYFLAFGLPSTAMCMSGSSLANAAVFALVYPAYIIMAMYANPKPDNPYQPLPPSEYDTTSEPVFPSPFIPIRIPFFVPVIWLNDRVVHILDFSTGGRRARRPSATQNVTAMEGVEAGVGYRPRQGQGIRVRNKKLD
ncbi:Etoposide-induced protein 2.4 (EI24) [Ceratobasidium sp. AG-Ba]|nr:Etoposide-induced protein 2.4 (EI24) [Ceratobasidium sp. AG-Ba]